MAQSRLFTAGNRTATSSHSNYDDEHYASLQTHCDQGSSIILQLSLPRSNSTAWQIAMVQADNEIAQINEPSFHDDWVCRPCDGAPLPGTRPSSEYFRKINQRMNEIKKQYTHPTLVVNDLSNAVSLKELELMLGLTQKICITVRDPLPHAHSLLTRFINDALSALGADNISPKQALELANQTNFAEEYITSLIHSKTINPKHILRASGLPEDTKLTSEILVKTISKTVERVYTNCIDICWDNLRKQLDLARTYANAKIIIINGDDLINDPKSILQQSCDAFGLTYTQDMVDNWTKATGDNFYCCVSENMPREYVTNNAWNGPVRNSRKIEKKANGMPFGVTLDSFPAVMHASIINAQNIFAAMTNSPEFLHTTSLPASHLNSIVKRR